MAEKTDFTNIRAIIGESNPEIRHALRASLHPFGFRNIIDTARLDTVVEAIKGDSVDLVICDHLLPDGGFVDVVRKVRHHQLGKNPFLVVIALVGDPSRDQIMAAIDSGADDLVAKPISTALLMDRISRLTKERQRHFIITSDYIGPDRRKAARPGATTASRALNEQKMERHSVQINYLVDHIRPHYLMGMADEEEVVPLLDRLLYTAEDISRRLHDSSYTHIAELCTALVDLVTRIRENAAMPDEKDIKLLPEMAAAISRAFHPDERAVEVAHDISETVAGRK